MGSDIEWTKIHENIWKPVLLGLLWSMVKEGRKLFVLDMVIIFWYVDILDFIGI